MAFVHLENSPAWEQGDQVTAPMGHWAYRHSGCGETMYVPSNTDAGGDEMVRAVMDVLITEFLADPEAADADRWALVHHLSGVVQLRRVTRWAVDQALGYIRSLAEMKLEEFNSLWWALHHFENEDDLVKVGAAVWERIDSQYGSVLWVTTPLPSW
ncbi:hypothetical protein AB0F17_03420 [Nonomuraea sp. NPDC026600]|uniref:hypothetical protein n=1 Tax=Nonomuraea sp. NPDC026600 TaxID=3155363 RepID=UPI00340EC879